MVRIVPSRLDSQTLQTERVVDQFPSPEVLPPDGGSRDAEQLRAFKAEGALLIHGAKE